MTNKFRKNIVALLGLALVAVFITSCSRGGYGCPYEIEVAGEVLKSVLN